ncbi:2976_t:CDS:2 [Funneliformis mosseae]|uniref:2976_t:CDS:1 n=1 Tax=Funneliformis mosseae TaxID=27381 RepID=A0A9N9FA74_FUNMO|nr:2976_t:CDS:2 [Funneliformis mosseae]
MDIRKQIRETDDQDEEDLIIRSPRNVICGIECSRGCFSTKSQEKLMTGRSKQNIACIEIGVTVIVRTHTILYQPHCRTTCTFRIGDERKFGLK